MKRVAAGIFVGLLIPAVLAAQVVPPPMPQPIEDLLDRVRSLKSEQKPEEALAVAQQAVELGGETGLAPSALARLMDEVGEIQFGLGRYRDSEATQRGALEVRERGGRLDDPGIAWSLHWLSLALLGQGRGTEAVPLLERAKAILESAAERDDPVLMLVLYQLGSLYAVLGRSEDSDAILRQMSEIGRRMIDEAGDPAAQTEPAAGAGDLASENLRWMRSILGQDGSMAFELRFVMEALAGYDAEDHGRSEEAKGLYQGAIDLALAERGASSPEAGCAWNALAGLERKLGRSREAEDLYRKAAAALEPVRQDFPLDLAFTWTGLARLARDAGQPRASRELYERALAVATEALSEDHTLVANLLYELASLPEEAGISKARREELLRRARWLYDRLLHPDLRRQDLESQRVMMEGVGRLAEALDCASRLSLKWTGTQPEQELSLANQLTQKAQGHLWYGGYSQAVPLFLRALEVHREALGGGHPLIVGDLQQLAAAELGWKRVEAGLAHAREATALLDRSLEAGHEPQEVLQQRAFRRGVFLTHLDLLIEAGGEGPLRGALAEESFEVGQRARASGTALTLEEAVARFDTGDADLADLARRFQDQARRRREIDRELLESAGRSALERDLAREQALRDESRTLDESLARLRNDLTLRHPAYADLVFPRPVPLARVRELLGADEALLAYLTTPRFTYAWLVRRDRLEVRRFVPGREDLQASVSVLRRSLDVARLRIEMQRGQSVPAFDFENATALYRDLLLPFEPGLRGVRHLFLVPDGPLEGLPFGVLVAERPSAADPARAFATARWFVREVASSVLPAVSSLAALRRPRTASRASRPFAGFGQPRSAEGVDPAADPGSPLSRLDRMRALRRLSDLQETRSELAGIGAALGGSSQDLHFGEAATEGAVRSLPLADYRVVAFSTHALLAGEAGAAEPALVLAPGGAGEDGRLTAREIMELKLDAELVLLLGCNTAAPDGTPEAEGLSGLARAFFHAGSRTLLVSHWAVPSEATVRLATETFARLRESGSSLAEALRSSMLRMAEEPERPELSHPVFWAAFVLVGDGARRP